jgi:hypothetical protein
VQLVERIEVTRGLIWEANTYQDLIEFLSYNLHGSPSPIEQNDGLYFIWRSIMSLQILTLSKLIKDDGAFSIKKLINIGSAKIKGFDKAGFLEDFEYLLGEYKKHKLGTIRDQFLAHLDITAEEIKTDIHMLCVTKNLSTSLFNRISLAVGQDAYVHDDKCVTSLKDVFDELDEYDKVKAVIMGAQIQQKKNIDVADFIAIKC